MRNQILCVIALLVAVLASSALAVDPNLVAWYQFDDGSGTIAHDSAGGHDGTINGATWVPGKVGGALSFDGINDYVDVLDNPVLRFTQNSSFTLCAWVRPTSASGDWGEVVGKFQTNKAYDLFTYDIDWWKVAQKFTFGVCQSGVAFVDLHPPDGSSPAGSWLHVACVYANRNMKMYVNGELQGSDYFPYDTGTNTANNDLGIGARLVNSKIEGYFNGTLDDIRIYNRALTADEIKTIPEPATIVLLGLGLTALGRKRKN